MRYTLDVPFKLGQAVYQAVYSYLNDRGERNDIITDWVVVGYKLDEMGHFSCICARQQGEIRRIEYITPEKLFATRAEAERSLSNKGKTE